MKAYKRIISLLLVVITIFSFVACDGEYIIGNNVSNNSNTNSTTESGQGTVDSGDGSSGFVPPEMNDDPTDDFTVTVLADGKPYKPRMEMLVYWNDGFSVHVAKLNDEGVARIDGLDGDYRVTLSNVPNEYAYDPNTNVAKNDDRNIVLNLYTLNNLSGANVDLYNCYSFRDTGVYAATINSPEDAVYFQYAPSGSGTYTIESWIDVTADNINPYIDVYGGSSEYKWKVGTTDGGGTVGSYTSNFIHTVQIASENISSGGQATYTFAVKADSKNNKYPVRVVFAVKRDGDFELSRPGSVNVSGGAYVSTHDFSNFNIEDHEYGSEYKIVYPEYRFNSASNVYVFDQNRFKIWKKSEGGDDFYHVYDLEKYADTNGYGPVLYANITTPTRFIDRAFSLLDYKLDDEGNPVEVIYFNLTANGYDYKHFIEGYTFLTTMGNINGGTYYCVNECTCHGDGETEPMSETGRACTYDCTNCNAECRRIKEELVGFEGYQAYANSDGMVPVTEELKEFLQGYCEKQQFFYDGTGRLEKNMTNGKYYQAVGESGWLFACAYYE